MSNENNVSEEDKELFRTTVGKIQSIKSIQSTNIKSRAKADVKNHRLLHDHDFLEDTFKYTITSESKLSFYRSALSKNQNLAFKRGKLSIEGTLDLHGLTADEAKTVLLQFINSHYCKHHRVLLIIHGKGRSHGIAKLKNLVNHWLPQCPEVLAFVSAIPKDGGTGALYLLLKG